MDSLVDESRRDYDANWEGDWNNAWAERGKHFEEEWKKRERHWRFRWDDREKAWQTWSNDTFKQSVKDAEKMILESWNCDADDVLTAKFHRELDSQGCTVLKSPTGT